MSILNKAIVAVVQKMPKSIVWVFSKKYIAGETLQDAVNLTKSLNEKGIYATLDVLGEAIQNKTEAVNFKNEALKVFDAIVENNLMANLSLKPSQMGLSLDEKFAFEQIGELCEKAKGINNFVRIDMEDSTLTDSTLNLYKKLHEKCSNVGVVVQAYLRRTYDDVVRYNKIGANYRLCKGIYVESPNIAYKDKQAIRDSYVKCLKAMFKEGNYVGIATHDEFLINEAYKLIKEMNIPKDKFEFQMLLGVREDLRDKINKDGYKIRVYVPYGEQWYLYSMRRLKENPQVAGHVFKNIFSIN